MSYEELENALKNLSLIRKWQQYQGVRMLFSSHGANAMDLVLDFCVNASHGYEKKFNIKAIPTPLHVTLLRFPNNIPPSQKDDAQKWAIQYRNKIWGKSENLPIILTQAIEFPFKRVKYVTIR